MDDIPNKTSQNKIFPSIWFCNYWNLCCDTFTREWSKNGGGGANSFNYPLVKIILCENMIPERFYVYQKKIIYKEKCGTTTK